MPSGDWYLAGPDGFGRSDVRVQLETDEGELHYTGLVQVKDAFKRVTETGGTTTFAHPYMRTIFAFDTGTAKYAWLNQSVFVGDGRLACPLQIEYRIFRLD